MVKRYRKKRKLKKWVKLFLVFILLFCIVSLFYFLFSKKNNIKNNKDVSKITQAEIVSNILSYDTEIDEEFLKWLLKNYGTDSLNKIDNYLKNNEYDKNIWHDVTGNSLIVLRSYTPIIC